MTAERETTGHGIVLPIVPNPKRPSRSCRDSFPTPNARLIHVEIVDGRPFKAVLENIFFQYGTNYLALFLFIIFNSNLLIYHKVSCECERIAADNTKLTNQTKKLANDVCALFAINSQVKLKLFVLTKPTFRQTIWDAWTQVLLAISVLFYFA